MDKRKTIKNIIIGVLGVVFMVFIDQITKIAITNSFELYESKPIIKGIFDLCYIQNFGAAFGILQNNQIFFIITTILFMIFGSIEYVYIPSDKKYNIYRFVFSMLFAGAIGNFIDRVCLGYVRDFLYVSIINFPVFNVADCYVCISIALAVIYSIFIGIKNDEYVLFNGIETFFNNIKNKNKS